MVESDPLPPTMPDGKPWPKISIVTPSYNQSCYVGHTIRSVLNQGYPNLEYVIIDGGSTDGSCEIIESYAHSLHYWCSEPDRGHGHALNKGFAKTSGEIMAWLNSDDLYTPWSFEIVADIFASHPDVEWVTGVHGSWDERGRSVGCQLVYKNIYDFLLGDYAWIQQESVFWRRSLWERTGSKIDEDYSLMVDGELWCRFFLHAELWHVPILLSGYRKHSRNRASVHHSDVLAEMDTAIDVLKKKVPAPVRRSADRLSSAKSLFKRLMRCRFPIDWNRLASRFYRDALSASQYPVIFYKSGQWIKSRRNRDIM